MSTARRLHLRPLAKAGRGGPEAWRVVVIEGDYRVEIRDPETSVYRWVQPGDYLDEGEVNGACAHRSLEVVVWDAEPRLYASEPPPAEKKSYPVPVINTRVT